MLTVFLVDKYDDDAMSLMEKLSDVKHGQLIPVSTDEMKAWRSGKILPITLPDHTPNKTTEGPPLQGILPISLAFE